MLLPCERSRCTHRYHTDPPPSCWERLGALCRLALRRPQSACCAGARWMDQAEWDHTAHDRLQPSIQHELCPPLSPLPSALQRSANHRPPASEGCRQLRCCTLLPPADGAALELRVATGHGHGILEQSPSSTCRRQHMHLATLEHRPRSSPQLSARSSRKDCGERCSTQMNMIENHGKIHRRRAGTGGACAPPCDQSPSSHLQRRQLLRDDPQPSRLAGLVQRPQVVPLHPPQLKGARREAAPSLRHLHGGGGGDDARVGRRAPLGEARSPQTTSRQHPSAPSKHDAPAPGTA